uniref:protein ENHANCED PSEUDOMONAS SUSCEPTIBILITY 1-like n=1 Tax=Erigeron canadensis TaxID=72917 RepID=UPI001CB9798F|nr:protein ENHANCED PSEUDOMONAS SUSCEPTIBILITY 1-like [Erigeron canadensis]
MPCQISSNSSTNIISKSTIFPATDSTLSDLKLSVSDLPMLSCHYIQKGNLFTKPQVPIPELLPLIKRALSHTLTHFPPLAGRLTTDVDGYVYISCNDAGVEFVHASATHLFINDVVDTIHVPDSVKGFFTFDRTVSYDGHFRPLLAVQVTELNDGIFIGFSVNHAVVDGTSLWNFINTLAEVCRGTKCLSKKPCFSRDSVLISSACLKVPEGGPKVTFDEHAPLTERVFRFSKESITKLKNRINNKKKTCYNNTEVVNEVELIIGEDKVSTLIGNWLKNASVFDQEKSKDREISSFQSLCALLWRAVTRARNFPSNKETTFRMAVNCRHRLTPELESFYFGNAIQSIPTYATAGDVLSHDLHWCAEQLNKNVLSHDDKMVRRFVRNWENDPKCFPLGNFDGAMLTMGSSPRFPMFDNDFGWGKPVAVRSGWANKFDGKISAFPGREGGGSVDLEVVLSPETMAGIESDPEFMEYVSSDVC